MIIYYGQLSSLYPLKNVLKSNCSVPRFNPSIFTFHPLYYCICMWLCNTRGNIFLLLPFLALPLYLTHAIVTTVATIALRRGFNSGKNYSNAYTTLRIRGWLVTGYVCVVFAKMKNFTRPLSIKMILRKISFFLFFFSHSSSIGWRILHFGFCLTSFLPGCLNGCLVRLYDWGLWLGQLPVGGMCNCLSFPRIWWIRCHLNGFCGENSEYFHPLGICFFVFSFSFTWST